MIIRCTNPKHPNWKNYGGRGISVCDEWRHSFKAFLAHIGPRPSSEHSLDRYPNNDGNYEPGNVRWATRSQQRRNTRVNHFVEISGMRKTIAEWVEYFQISRNTVQARIKAGWSVERALSTPPKRIQEVLVKVVQP
jgi:hypothetical protein